MSESNTAEGGSLISKIPSGLTKYLYDRAAAAIGHLVGAYAPKVLADSQAAKDERDARSAFVAALAKAASEKATQNPELVDRMLTRLVGEEITKQQNREAIAIAAIEHLSDDQFEEDPKESVIDPDWLNIFGEFAERASSESIREIWSKILAGEIRSPGNFSLTTLQFISLLDNNSASLINNVLPWLINSDFIAYRCVDHGITVGELLFLEQIGFCSGHEGLLTVNIPAQKNGFQIIRLGDHGLVVDNNNRDLNIKALPLSLAGKQLCRIIHAEPNIPDIIELIEACKPKSIKLGRVKKVEGHTAVVDFETKYPRRV